MRCPARTRDQRLHAAQTRRVDGKPGRGDESIGFLHAALQFETHHAAVTAEEFSGDTVLWMVFQARVMNPQDLRVLCEEPRYLETTLIVLAHPHRERFHT